MTSPPTAPADTYTLLPVDVVHPHPRNPRRSLGDLAELVRSIKAVGILEPLVVLPADADGRHLAVAGHRRHAAAVRAGLTHVPAVVRAMEDAEVLEAALHENSHRDGLSPVEEAEAFAALMSLREGLTVRALATKVARSQNYVRARLAILALPRQAVDAIHRGQLALEAGLALTKLADWPEEIERLVRDDRVSDWEIERVQRAKEHEVKAAALAAEAAERGVALLGADDYDGRRTPRVAELFGEAAEQRRHAKEPCHAAVVLAGYSGPSLVPVCTEPRRHRPSAPAAQRSELTAERRPTRDPEGERRTQRRAAARAREAFLVERLGTKGGFPRAEAVHLGLLALVAETGQNPAARACRLLGLDPCPTPYDGKDFRSPLRTEALRSAADLARVAAVCAVAAAEEQVGTWGSYGSPLFRACFESLVKLGYQPSDYERAELDQALADATADDAADGEGEAGSGPDGNADEAGRE